MADHTIIQLNMNKQTNSGETTSEPHLRFVQPGHQQVAAAERVELEAGDREARVVARQHRVAAAALVLAASGGGRLQ